MFVYGRKVMRWLVVCVFVFLVACSVPNEPVIPSVLPQTPTNTSTPVPSATNTLQPTITPLPTRVTPTVYPPMSSGEDWVLYHNDNLGLEFSYPPNWILQSEAEIRGRDGFIWLTRIASDGKQPDAFCQLNVNAGIPQTYGNFPEIRNLYSQGFYGCLMVPSLDSSQAGIATAFLWQTADKDNLINVVGSQDFIMPILGSSISLQPPKLLSIDGIVPYGCRLNEAPPAVFETGGLKFDVYRLTSDDCYQIMEVETFASLLPRAARDKAADLRELTPSYIEQINQSLAPFDLKFNEGKLYYQDETVLPFAIEWIGLPEVNAAQTEFYLPVMGGDSGIPEMITLNGVEPVPYHFLSSFGYVPSRVFFGNDLISVTFDEDHPAEVGDLYHLQVRRNEDIIFSYVTLPYGPPGGPVRGLWREGDSWLLDLADVFIKDGEILNDTFGYQAMFTYRQINDKPFYFYQQDDSILLSYDGQTLPVTYQEVLHKPSCCSAAMVNMTLGYDGLAFYGLQDGFWVYTVITAAK